MISCELSITFPQFPGETGRLAVRTLDLNTCSQPDWCLDCLKSGCFDGLNGLNISQLMVEQLFFLKDVVILMILMIDCPIWMVQTTDEKQRWMAQTKNEQFHLLFSAIPNLPPYLRLDDVWCFHPLLVCWMVKSPCFIIQQPFLLVKLHVWWQTSCVIYIP